MEDFLATETIFFTSADGLTLEGRLATPEGPPLKGGVVLCHPHPQYGGSMSSKLIPALQRALLAAGWAALRFNFRGVGRSEGSFDDGVGEVADVRGALARVREAVAEPAAVVGWSFGALVALNAVADDPGVAAYVGVAPPVRAAFEGTFILPQVSALDAWKARALLVGGTTDPFCRPDDLRALAGQLPSADVRVVEGADHFFSDHTDELTAIVTGFVDEI
ncbi:MAG TPA: alpha/beta fold hydrolase [Actinomycetota bacterium]|nr:alpha/beta fold hydrolase [Actinomycetota bacterium]